MVLCYKNHFFICAGLGMWLSGLFLALVEGDYYIAAALIIVFTIAGGLYPDFIDKGNFPYPWDFVEPEWKSKLGDITHRAKGIRRSTLPFWIWLLVDIFWFYGDGMPLFYMVAFVIGQHVHLILDSLTKGGIPFRKRRLALGVFKKIINDPENELDAVYDMPWYIRFILTIVMMLQGAYLWSLYLDLAPFFESII